MSNDRKCKWRNSCGYDFCHGEGVCAEFKNRKPPKETVKGYHNTANDTYVVEAYGSEAFHIIQLLKAEADGTYHNPADVAEIAKRDAVIDMAREAMLHHLVLSRIGIADGDGLRNSISVIDAIKEVPRD